MKSIITFNRLLLVLLVFIGAMIAARIFYSHSLRYIFLIWNLFLAWLPYLLSGLFGIVRSRSKLKQGVLFLTWLLLFPNALYIITDLIHLKDTTNVPLWYDALLVFASSFAGLIMAFASLQRAEVFLKNMISGKIVLALVPFILFLGAFGVYLGRFERWNSWNVINDPLALGSDIFSILLFPHDNMKTWATIFILTGLYCILYFFIKIIPKTFSETLPA